MLIVSSTKIQVGRMLLGAGSKLALRLPLSHGFGQLTTVPSASPTMLPSHLPLGHGFAPFSCSASAAGASAAATTTGGDRPVAAALVVAFTFFLGTSDGMKTVECSGVGQPGGHDNNGPPPFVGGWLTEQQNNAAAAAESANNNNNNMAGHGMLWQAGMANGMGAANPPGTQAQADAYGGMAGMLNHGNSGTQGPFPAQPLPAANGLPQSASGAMGGLGMGATNGMAPAYGGQANGHGGTTSLPLMMNHGISGTQGPFSAPPAPMSTPNPSPYGLSAGSTPLYGLSAGSTPLNSGQSNMSDPPTQGFLLGLERTGDFNPTLENQQALGRFQQEQNDFFAHAEATRQSRDNRHYQHHLERQQLLQNQQHADATEAECFRLTSFQRDLSAVIFLQANPTFGLRPVLADHSQPAAQNLGPTFEHVAGQNTPSNGPSNGGVPPTGSQLPAMGGQATWGSRGAVPTTPAPGHGSFPSTIQGASQSYRTPAPRSASSAPGRQVHGLSSNLFGSASASGAGGQDSSAGVAGNGPSASSAPSFAAPSFAAPSTVMRAPAPSVSGAATSQSGSNLANSQANSSVATGNAVVSRPVWVPPVPAAAAVPSTNHAQTSGAGILTAPAPANAMDESLPSTSQPEEEDQNTSPTDKGPAKAQHQDQNHTAKPASVPAQTRPAPSSVPATAAGPPASTPFLAASDGNYRDPETPQTPVTPEDAPTSSATPTVQQFLSPEMNLLTAQLSGLSLNDAVLGVAAAAAANRTNAANRPNTGFVRSAVERIERESRRQPESNNTHAAGSTVVSGAQSNNVSDSSTAGPMVASSASDNPSDSNVARSTG